VDSDICDVHTIVTKMLKSVTEVGKACRQSSWTLVTNLHTALQNSADICFTLHD